MSLPWKFPVLRPRSEPPQTSPPTAPKKNMDTNINAATSSHARHRSSTAVKIRRYGPDFFSSCTVFRMRSRLNSFVSVVAVKAIPGVAVKAVGVLEVAVKGVGVLEVVEEGPREVVRRDQGSTIQHVL